MKRLLVISLLLLGFIFAQSSITIGGTGTAATSAHITVTTNGYKCPGEFIVEGGASLTTWDPSAICGASTSGSGDVSLPVELTEFTAEQVGSSVILRWTTESELENIGFIIDRKVDDTNWSNIADYRKDNELLGHGTASNSNQYEFIDNLVEADKTYYYRLADVSTDGITQYHNKISITVAAVDETTQPSQFALYPAYPNPFNPVTNIKFDVPEKSKVKISIYNQMGELVRILLSDIKDAGHHTIQWDSKDTNGQKVCAGVYLYRIESDNYQKTMKMILLK